jgi:VIT1/CCC1 family predicted Fe2+/Mn2+ transporter
VSRSISFKGLVRRAMASGPPADSSARTTGRAAVRPHSDDELRKRVLGERGRIARLSRIREFVLGFQDGLLVPLGVVTGLAGAAAGSVTVIVGGLAEAGAGALAMGTGAYLSSQAENQLFKNEIAAEERGITKDPEVEKAELEILFQEEGLDAQDAKVVTERIAKKPQSFIKTMVEKELGLSYEDTATATLDALVVGGAYALAAGIPLWPYFIWGVGLALPVSLAATGFALMVLGVIKGRVVHVPLFSSGFKVLLLGGGSAAVGFGIGKLIPLLLGG